MNQGVKWLRTKFASTSVPWNPKPGDSPVRPATAIAAVPVAAGRRSSLSAAPTVTAGDTSESPSPVRPPMVRGAVSGGAELTVLRTTSRDWLATLGHAVTEGSAVLIEDITDDLDAALEPLLSRSFKKAGRNLFVSLGDASVQFNPSFRLYLQVSCDPCSLGTHCVLHAVRHYLRGIGSCVSLCVRTDASLEPTLPARGAGAVHAGELHGDVSGAGGPAARLRGAARDARP